MGKGEGDWNNGLFGCFNSLGNCMCGWCCGPCQVGETASRMGESYPLFCLLTCCVPCVPLFLLRKQLRDTHNIDGDAAGDCCAAWCCVCCVSVQMANELDDLNVSK